MRAMAFGHLVPARPEDPGRLARHAEKQGLLLSLFKHPRRCHTGFPQPTEGRAESEAEKMCGSQEGGKSQGGRTAADSLARNAVSRRSGRVHEGPPPGQNARQLGGVKIPRPHPETDRTTPVSTCRRPPSIPIAPPQGSIIGQDVPPFFFRSCALANASNGDLKRSRRRRGASRTDRGACRDRCSPRALHDKELRCRPLI